MQIKKRDEWCKCAWIAMTLQGKDIRSLADELGYTRQFVSGVLNGYYPSLVARKRISRTLNIWEAAGRKTLQDIWRLLEAEKRLHEKKEI